MKRIIISKTEHEYLIYLLEELYNITPDEPISNDWINKMEKTRRLFDLEMNYFNIRDDGQNPTKKQMVKWLIFKIKNKTADLN